MPDRTTIRDAYRLLDENMGPFCNAIKLDMIERHKKTLASALKEKESPWDPVLDQIIILLGPKSQQACDTLLSVWARGNENFPDPL